MAQLKSLIALMAVLVVLGVSVERVLGEGVQHVVGDDHGWDPSNDLDSWSSGKHFRVGDILWFTYGAAQESVVELRTIEALLSCDLKNPIKMYTEGLDGIQLHDEGSRYFASGNLESCKKGLKIHVNVQPKDENDGSEPHSKAQDFPLADGPTQPFSSGSKRFSGLSLLLLCGFLFYYLGFY